MSVGPPAPQGPAASRSGSRPTRQGFSLGAHLPIVIAVLSGAALSLVAYSVAHQWESQLARQRFEWTAREVLYDTRTDVAHALDSMATIAAFIRSSRAIEPSEFRDFTSRLLERSRGVEALGIVERRRPSYPIVHLEPQAQFPGVLGSDLASSAEVRATLDSARGETVTLVAHPGLPGDPDPGRSYLAVMAARSTQSKLPGNSDAVGPPQLVIAVLDMTNLLVRPTSAGVPPLRVEIHPESSTTLAASNPHPSRSPPADEAWRHAIELSIGGLEFVLVASSPVAPWSAGFWWIRWAALLIGFGTTSLVAAFLRASAARNRLLREQKEESDQRFHGAFEAASHGMALVGVDGRWLRVNPALGGMLGYSVKELEAMDFQSITPADDLPDELVAFDRLLRGELPTYRAERRYLKKDGAPVWVDLSVVPVFDADGSVDHLVYQVIDLSRRKEAEENLVQAQKMESIGQLTGGLAHDFNNLLTVVLGNVELAERRASKDERLASLLRTARGAAERGATLTRQLLAFARRQPLAPKIIVLSDALTDLGRLMQRTIGEEVSLEISSAPDLWPVRVDPVQLETAVLNLVVNARDAIEGNGAISIRAHNQPVDVHYAAMEKITPGDYVLLSVTDDGAGIPRENLDKVVSPFFTTKEVGKGSGLGLSMVYGFVKQSDGHVKIYSEVGVGTTVKLYLPRVSSTQMAATTAMIPDAITMAREGERVLVVEDQADVRALTTAFLEELGYDVVQADSGKSALRLLEQDPDIDLILSDVVMPGELDGFELASAVAERFPGTPVVLASGYPGHRADDTGVKDEEVLLKPFSLRSLGDRVRRSLDRAVARSATG